jgi:hypothetical protein
MTEDITPPEEYSKNQRKSKSEQNNKLKKRLQSQIWQEQPNQPLYHSTIPTFQKRSNIIILIRQGAFQ